MAVTVYLDRVQRNADWIKTVSWEYPTDMGQFLQFIGGPAALEHFLTLPVAEAMPLTLRVELGLAHNPKGLSFKDFVESQHPRDTHGRFAETAGVSGILEPNASRIQDFSPDERDTWSQIMDDYGVSITDLRDKMAAYVDQDAIDHAESWYPSASQISTDLAAETGISKDRIATAFGICSPKCVWKDKKTGEGEERYVSEMARFIGRGTTEDGQVIADMDPMEAFLAWKDEYTRNNTVLTLKGKPAKPQLMNQNGAKGMAVMMGKLDPEDVLNDNKTRSFFDNIMDPGGTHEVTIDTHMGKVVEMVYGVSAPDAIAFLGSTGGTVKKGNRVLGAGYVAVRMIALEYDVPPDVAQAAFWEKIQEHPHISWDDGVEWPTGKAKVKKPKKGKSWLEW
jgi:hypothetical protein